LPKNRSLAKLAKIAKEIQNHSEGRAVLVFLGDLGALCVKTE
jgi:hypothetical protein